MSYETIRELLHKRPFEPFEVILSSGERHQVRHPEFAILTRSRLVITDPVADRVAINSLIHITELWMLEPASGEEGSG